QRWSVVDPVTSDRNVVARPLERLDNCELGQRLDASEHLSLLNQLVESVVVALGGGKLVSSDYLIVLEHDTEFTSNRKSGGGVISGHQSHIHASLRASVNRGQRLWSEGIDESDEAQEA